MKKEVIYYMTPYEALTEKDLYNIKNYIKDYGFMYDPQDDLIAPMQIILEEWNTNKATLFRMLEGNLILRRPYTFAIPEEGMIYNFRNNKNDSVCNIFRNIWTSKIATNNNISTLTCYNKETKQFDKNLKCWDSDLRFDLTCCTDADSLAKNIWKFQEYKLKFEDGEIFKLSTGMKLMKVFHKFVEKFDPAYLEIFEQFRIWHSQILNNKYLDGEICLSIHPLDYMTMSDNDNGWKSCMRWQGEGRGDVGDYRAGTIECMNSPIILVAYLHNPEHQMDLSDGYVSSEKWNSKKWRELFIVDDEGLIINEIKAYPYQDENLTNTILMWIKELAENNLGFTYDNDEIDVSKASVKDEINHKNVLVDFSTNDYMYKDIGTLDKHRGRINRSKIFNYIGKYFDPSEDYYIYTDEKGNQWKNYTLDIPYGGAAYCMCCGAAVVDGAERVICSSCDAGYVCSCCGNAIHSKSEMYYMDDIDDYICEDCYNWETGTDEFSEDSYMNHNLIDLYWKPYDGYVSNNPWVKSLDEYYDRSVVTYNGWNASYYSVLGTAPKYDYKNHVYYVTTDQIVDKEAFSEIFSLSAEEMHDLLHLYI